MRLPFRFISALPVLCCLALLTAFDGAAVANDEAAYARRREALIRRIESDVRDTRYYLDKQALDPRVMQALATVPRHAFVPSRLRRYAYDNRPLPIGYGQTISQPYIVAIMTDLLKPVATDRVLEIGTGSGYQAAVLAGLVREVFSMEIIQPLGERARDVLHQQGYGNIEVRIGDGYYGWKERAPFDAIVVTAAADHIPPPLIDQLKPGGRMVIPVGSRFLTQELVLVEKRNDGDIVTRQILPVRFVPLTGDH